MAKNKFIKAGEATTAVTPVSTRIATTDYDAFKRAVKWAEERGDRLQLNDVVSQAINDAILEAEKYYNRDFRTADLLAEKKPASTDSKSASAKPTTTASK